MGVSRSLGILSACVFLFAVVYLTVCYFLVPLIEQPDPIPASFTTKYPHEPSDVLANLYPSTPEGEPRFFFGVANSANQVEDNLNDSWIQLAKGDSGMVKAWKNYPLAEERLRFWSEPDVDIDLAAESGASVFRLSLDWGRIVPVEPVDGTEEQVDWNAVKHYRDILGRVQGKGLKVMVTLFHFAAPSWAIPFGGWTDPRMVKYYTEFTKLVKREFGDYIDYWVTFNEPNIFVIFTHCTRSFPSKSQDGSLFTIAMCFIPKTGLYHKALKYMTEGHFNAYEILHEGSDKPVGLAHFGVLVRPYGLIESPGAVLLREILSYSWLDNIIGKLDFCGINYYGREIGSMVGLMVDTDEAEYSEAGRGLFPNGLYEVLTTFHRRYKTNYPALRYIVTENGVGDATDKIRRPFLIEHLLAVAAAREQGVPIDGYIYWTMSDNWEWIDGYCPRFGLVDVERGNNLKRVPRSSYYLFRQLAKTGIITAEQRKTEWDNLQKAKAEGMQRPFCRAPNSLGAAGIDSEDEPFMRSLSDQDWRFGAMPAMTQRDYAAKSAGLIWKIIKLVFHEITAKLSFKPTVENSKIHAEL